MMVVLRTSAKMMAVMRTSTEMIAAMQASSLELKNEVVTMKEQLSTPLVPPYNGNNTVVTAGMPTLCLQYLSFDGTDLEIWINEV